MTKLQYVLIAVGILAIGFVLGVAGSRSTQSLGATSYDRSNLVGDVYQGLNSVLMMSGGVFVGPITSSQSVTLSGTNTLSGATTLSGTVSATGATTLKCPKVYNGATTTTAYYMYASGTTLFATTTKPALCP